jgi:5-hydroxyisourate hydrolase
MSQKSPITTHVLDTSRGRPASRVAVCLERRTEAGGFAHLADGTTDEDGRVTDLLDPGAMTAGVYRISFDTDGYYARVGGRCFYPSVSITFRVEAEDEHYHVPLLLNPFGYSTYRGS